MATIILLAAFGFLLLLTEMFIPGGVLGVLGVLTLVAAVVTGYVEFGALTGTVVLAVVGGITLVGFCAWMALFPRTTVGRKLMLGRTLLAGDTLPSSAGLVGREGVAVTGLRPSGTALIDARRVDVVAEGAFIEVDDALVVIAAEGARVVVRKKA